MSSSNFISKLSQRLGVSAETLLKVGGAIAALTLVAVAAAALSSSSTKTLVEEEVVSEPSSESSPPPGEPSGSGSSSAADESPRAVISKETLLKVLKRMLEEAKEMNAKLITELQRMATSGIDEAEFRIQGQEMQIKMSQEVDNKVGISGTTSAPLSGGLCILSPTFIRSARSLALH